MNVPTIRSRKSLYVTYRFFGNRLALRVHAAVTALVTLALLIEAHRDQLPFSPSVNQWIEWICWGVLAYNQRPIGTFVDPRHEEVP